MKTEVNKLRHISYRTSCQTFMYTFWKLSFPSRITCSHSLSRPFFVVRLCKTFAYALCNFSTRSASALVSGVPFPPSA